MYYKMYPNIWGKKYNCGPIFFKESFIFICGAKNYINLILYLGNYNNFMTMGKNPLY